MLNHNVDSGWYSVYDNWDKGLWFIIAEKSVGIYGIRGENTTKTLRLTIQRYFVRKPVDFEKNGFWKFRIISVENNVGGNYVPGGRNNSTAKRER